jgi:fluoroacetyl-CoA thioesterase
MKETLKTGISSTRTYTIDKGRTVSFMGDALRIYATPSVVADMEYACLEFLDEYSDDHESSVGAHVDIKHMKPTPLGAQVVHEITIENIEGPKVTFAVVVRDDIEEVARASHTRVVVDKDRLEAGVKAKIATLKDAS